jgi:DMSO/TMAO reductase YedYZ molybdopterin-dependent catalytic subunit
VAPADHDASDPGPAEPEPEPTGADATDLGSAAVTEPSANAGGATEPGGTGAFAVDSGAGGPYAAERRAAASGGGAYTPEPGAARRAATEAAPTEPYVDPAEPETRGAPIGRRVVLGMLGLGAAGVVFGDTIQSRVERALRPLTQNDPTGVSSFLPTAGRFRIYTVTGHLPERSTGEYRLTVDGMVETPLNLSYDDLLARPQTDLTLDFQCVTGWRVADVPWTGVRLSALLDEAGVDPGATHLRIWSFDGAYTESLTVDQARRDDVIAAHRMQDGPVSREHGGPVRLYVGPMYGYKSLKWLERIEVVDQLHEGYWEVRGYDVDAWVGRSNGRDDEPTS